MRIVRSPIVRAPYIAADIVHLPASVLDSEIHTETDTFIAVDMYRENSVSWYFFLDGRPVDWADLPDRLRWLVRKSAREYLSNRSHLWIKYNPGEYQDDGYYVLEALETL